MLQSADRKQEAAGELGGDLYFVILSIYLFVFTYFLRLLEIETRALHLQDKYIFTPGPQPQPYYFFFQDKGLPYLQS